MTSRAGTGGEERIDVKSQENAFCGGREVLSAYGDSYTTVYVSQNLPSIFFEKAEVFFCVQIIPQ